MVKETVNKVLVALAAVFTVFGLLNLAGASNFLVENLDSLWAAGLTVVGVIVGLIGFFKPSVPTAEATDVKSVIGQVLIALGAVSAFLGLTKLTDIVAFLLTNLDTAYAAVLTLVGVVLGLIAYFKGDK